MLPLGSSLDVAMFFSASSRAGLSRWGSVGYKIVKGHQATIDMEVCQVLKLVILFGLSGGSAEQMTNSTLL